MCPGNAEASANYVNGQLAALYENAVACSDKHQVKIRPEDAKIELGTCLRIFFSPTKQVNPPPISVDDFPFFARFSRPRLEFVCNHKVILHLIIEEGHCRPEGDNMHRFGAFELSYLVEYETRTSQLEKSDSGSQDRYTSFIHFLNFNTAELISDSSKIAWEEKVTDGTNRLKSVKYHINTFYFPILKKASYHVFYSLPYPDIDYSTINIHNPVIETLYGVHVADINNFLRDLWLQAALHVSENSLENREQAECYLAQIRTRADADGKYMVFNFKPPRVQPLCICEAVLYLNIESVTVHDAAADETKKPEEYEDCCIAFVTNIVYKENDYGMKRVSLDLSHIRHSETRTTFDKYAVDDVNIKQAIVVTITTYYIKHFPEEPVVFHHEPSLHDPEKGDEGAKVPECWCESPCTHNGIRWGDINRRLITQTDVQDFDFISAITQHGVNAHYRALWEAAHLRFQVAPDSAPEDICLSKFTLRDSQFGNIVFFEAEFDSPQVQLRVDTCSIILYIQMKNGVLKQLGSRNTLDPNSQDIPFLRGRLAFEIDLKLIDIRGEALSKSIQGRAHSAKISYKQLILDFASAKCNLSLSKFDVNVESESTYRAFYEALVHYVKNVYFRTLHSASHHVLYIIPLLSHGIHRPKWFNYRVVRFAHDIPDLPFEGICGRHSDLFARNSIVIAGLFSDRKLKDSYWFPTNMNWVGGFGNEIPHGFVSLSNRVFLGTVILQNLESYNRKTTIIPKIAGVKEQDIYLELCAWDKHPIKGNEPCDWQRDENPGENIKFTWHNDDHLTYDHKSNFDNSRQYTVDCTNLNELFLPVVQQRTSRITVRGNNTLQLSYKLDKLDGASEESSYKGGIKASWEIEIILDSTSAGLKISAMPKMNISPKFESKENVLKPPDLSISSIGEASKQFRQQFPFALDFGDLLIELKKSFEGVWEGSLLCAYDLRAAYPVFNHRGDFLFELHQARS